MWLSAIGIARPDKHALKPINPYISAGGAIFYFRSPVKILNTIGGTFFIFEAIL